jgi:CheY-like chemotaxis protein
MKILIIEDHGIIATNLSEYLIQLGHDVTIAYSIIEASIQIETIKYDLFIIDLNLPAEGLTKSEIEESLHGVLTGWIWIKNYLLKRNISLKERVIILSEYVNVLKKHFLAQDLNGICMISKRSDRMIEIILEQIEKITNAI